MGKATNTQPVTSAVGYYRVSTQKQGNSGLGLDSQRTKVSQYCQENHLTIVEEFIEIESGRKVNRVKLNAALDAAKRQNARLIIAKLDRLSRNAAFTMALRDSGVDFVACDLPDANTLTIGILSSFAQWEAERISQRTKDALKAAKARGTKLGAPEHLTPGAQRLAVAANILKATEAYAKLMNYVGMLRNDGMSYQIVADRLNQDGYRTRNGAQFTPATVHRMVKRTMVKSDAK